MNREDHEKERLKWLQKLEDAETRLAQTETINHEMNQLKAELNKKIIEMERNQKPLIEQNRKLAERNRLLQGEFKKCEHKLSHSQEDFLTLKDNYERLLKENTVLKEKRLFPEKLEELDRYKNQVLEYSKCITALRQAGIEKDRRYEILIHKFKLLRKAVSRRLGDADDDHQSSFGGSDCSAESSISLNTITEDLQETENNVSSLTANALLQERVITLQAKSDSLERQLNEAKETNELLEFQLLESKELMNQEHEKKPVEKIERSVETDRWIKNGENLESKISSEETVCYCCALSKKKPVICDSP
ncbi:hypothetical protein AB6A40_006606 [Gnathostoma spinigerum]|uniref:Uncharacterized protein n=1 Tax=Gnathostoma spinigerum TaxID=75299 RepID=A0ABD6ETM3_9BILA